MSHNQAINHNQAYLDPFIQFKRFVEICMVPSQNVIYDLYDDIFFFINDFTTNNEMLNISNKLSTH